jgi:hypothetical protein
VIRRPPGHGGDHPTLHINTRWKECSFQLSPELTQSAWRQFTREAGLVAYFRPLSDARPMGRGNFEVSLLQWGTGIDDADPAWNDTFVHPDAEHALFEGSRLQFPGLMVRAGLTANTDAGLYITKSPGANYGFVGGQVQHNLMGGTFRMYGPEDLDFSVYGADLVTSRRITLSRWASVSPYAGVSTYMGSSHEKSAVVSLDDERVVGAQGMLGAVLQLSAARLSAEYNVAAVNTMSLKVGFGW